MEGTHSVVSKRGVMFRVLNRAYYPFIDQPLYYEEGKMEFIKLFIVLV